MKKTTQKNRERRHRRAELVKKGRAADVILSERDAARARAEEAFKEASHASTEAKTVAVTLEQATAIIEDQTKEIAHLRKGIIEAAARVTAQGDSLTRAECFEEAVDQLLDGETVSLADPLDDVDIALLTRLRDQMNRLKKLSGMEDPDKLRRRLRERGEELDAAHAEIRTLKAQAAQAAAEQPTVFESSRWKQLAEQYAQAFMQAQNEILSLRARLPPDPPSPSPSTIETAPSGPIVGPITGLPVP